MGVAGQNLQALWKLVESIPHGSCCAYGDLGRELPNPVSGYIVGRWMAQCPEGLPWWRVVAKDGRLPIHRRDPRLSNAQREHLQSEGVTFIEDRVDMPRHAWSP